MFDSLYQTFASASIGFWTFSPLNRFFCFFPSKWKLMTSSSFLCHFFGLIFLGSLVRIRFFSGVENKFISTQNEVSNRPPQDIEVRVVLDFQMPCYRPETTALYPRRFLTNHEGHGLPLGTGKMASKIQDDEDVDVLRRPGIKVKYVRQCRLWHVFKIQYFSMNRSSKEGISNLRACTSLYLQVYTAEFEAKWGQMLSFSEKLVFYREHMRHMICPRYLWWLAFVDKPLQEFILKLIEMHIIYMVLLWIIGFLDMKSWNYKHLILYLHLNLSSIHHF